MAKEKVEVVKPQQVVDHVWQEWKGQRGRLQQVSEGQVYMIGPLTRVTTDELLGVGVRYLFGFEHATIVFETITKRLTIDSETECWGVTIGGTSIPQVVEQTLKQLSW